MVRQAFRAASAATSIGMAYNGELTIFVVADRSLADVADGVCAGIQAWFDSLSEGERDVTVAIPGRGLRSVVAVAR